jgi:hypothetical protein
LILQINNSVLAVHPAQRARARKTLMQVCYKFAVLLLRPISGRPRIGVAAKTLAGEHRAAASAENLKKLTAASGGACASNT